MSNIIRETRINITFPVSWLFIRLGDSGRACMRFSLSCLRFHQGQVCPLCKNPFKGFSHFFLCSHRSLEMLQLLQHIQIALPSVNCVHSPLDVLNNPSLLSNVLSNPMGLLNSLAYTTPRFTKNAHKQSRSLCKKIQIMFWYKNCIEIDIILSPALTGYPLFIYITISHMLQQAASLLLLLFY